MMNNAIILHLEEEEREKRRKFIQIRKNIRANLNIINIPEHRFLELFRLPKNIVFNLINNIREYLKCPITIAGITPELKVLIALRFFAVGSYQRCIGQDFNLGVSQSTVSRYMKEVAIVIETHLLNIWVKFPVNNNEKTNLKQTFLNKYNFPGCIGCIDGTHISILKPKIESHNYMNRKGYYSKNVQIICDARLKILNINARHAGSSHDSYIWRNSAVREYLSTCYENGDRSSWLLGDSGYPLEPWLMTPVLRSIPNSPEDRYNRRHSKTRNCVERTIGLLKTKFRCLLKERTLRYSPRMAGILANVCSILHNISIENNLVNDEVYNLDIENEFIYEENEQENLNSGQIIRNQLIRTNFT